MLLAILRDPLQYMAPIPNKLLASWIFSNPSGHMPEVLPITGGLRLELLPHLLRFALRRIPGCEVCRAAVVRHLRSKKRLICEGNEDTHGDALKPMRFMAEDPNNKDL